MTGEIHIPIWVLVSIGFFALLVLGWSLVRLVRSREPSIKRDRGEERATELVDQLLTGPSSAVEQVAESLRKLDDLEAVDSALMRRLRSASTSQRARFVKVYEGLGLIDWHRDRLREGASWADRADSAYALGRLRVVSAIPDLTMLLRRGDLDSERVRMAVAQALADKYREQQAQSAFAAAVVILRQRMRPRPLARAGDETVLEPLLWWQWTSPERDRTARLTIPPRPLQDELVTLLFLRPDSTPATELEGREVSLHGVRATIDTRGQATFQLAELLEVSELSLVLRVGPHGDEWLLTSGSSLA